MSNFKNFQKSRARNTSWPSESDSDGRRPHDLTRTTLNSSNSSILNQHNHRPNPLQRSSTPIPITTYSAAAYPTSGSSSPTQDSSDSGSGYFNPCQRYVPQYFLSSLSTDSSPDRENSLRKNGKHNSNNYVNQRNRMHKTRSRDPPQPSSGNSSSTKSSVSTGDNYNFQLHSPKIRRSDPVDSSSSDSDSHRNFPENYRIAWDFGRNPAGIPISIPTKYFIGSNYLNAPAASILPQPPQNWLVGRAEARIKEEDIELERVMATIVNTYDYYNLKMLLNPASGGTYFLNK